MSKKYKFTGETMLSPDGTSTLHKIVALKDFSDMRGDIEGGWIEKEENLSQEGDCWVYSDAMVYGNATVRDNAVVCDEAIVCGNAIVCDEAIVRGNAIVTDNAVVYGEVEIFDDCHIL